MSKCPICGIKLEKNVFEQRLECMTPECGFFKGLSLQDAKPIQTEPELREEDGIWMCSECGGSRPAFIMVCGNCGSKSILLESSTFGEYGKTSALADEPEPPPIPNDKPALWDLVIADMHSRDRFGEGKYNMRIQPHNGRDFLKDLYDELRDACVYVRGLIYERDGK